MEKVSPDTSESETANDLIEIEEEDCNNNNSKPRDLKPLSSNSRATPLLVGTTETLHVVHLVSPSEIYFVKERYKFCKFCKDVERKAEALPPTRFVPEVGTVVFVKGSDKLWYR